MGVCHCNDDKGIESNELQAFTQDEPPLTIAVVRGLGLRGPDWFPGGDEERYLSCSVCAPGTRREFFTTRAVPETLAPVWREEAGLVQYAVGSSLQFNVWDSDEDGEAELLGKVVLRAERFELGGFNGELQLKQPRDRGLADPRVAVKVRHAGRRFPEGPLEEFSVLLDNAVSKRKALGVDFDLQDGATMYVTGIKAGLIQSYNSRVDPAHRVEAGDFVMRVNGAEGDTARLLERIKKDSRIELVVRRPMRLDVVVGTCDCDEGRAPAAARLPPAGPRRSARSTFCGRDGSRAVAPLPSDCGDPERSIRGMQLKEPLGNSLMITRVMGGPVEEWNAANPEQAVMSGDRIVAVDGKKAKADEMLKWIRASERFHMTVIRPSNLEGSPRDPRVPPLPLHRVALPS